MAKCGHFTWLMLVFLAAELAASIADSEACWAGSCQSGGGSYQRETLLHSEDDIHTESFVLIQTAHPQLVQSLPDAHSDGSSTKVQGVSAGKGVAIEPRSVAAELIKYESSAVWTGETEFLLAERFRHGVGTDINKPEALRLYLVAVNDGHRGALQAAACMLRDGEGVPRDTARSASLLERGVAQGCAGAMADLAGMKFEGMGCEQDIEGGVHLLQDASKLGHTPACQHLANCYLHGFGVQADQNESRRLLQLGVRAGDADYQQLLESLERDDQR